MTRSASRRLPRLALTITMAALATSDSGRSVSAGDLPPVGPRTLTERLLQEPDLSLWDAGRIAAWRESRE